MLLLGKHIKQFSQFNRFFSSGEYKNTAIERLSLKVINSKLNEKILPFVKKFLEHAPNLQTLDLTVEATSSYVSYYRWN